MSGAALRLIGLTAFVALVGPGSAHGQNSPVSSFAVVNVNVITMRTSDVHPDQTVLVRGNRIAAVGPSHAIPLDEDTVRIDGRGLYLLPGLTDAHVHLTSSPWAPGRPEFGDAPLYLAHGVTTVINLYGTPEQLDWRRRVATGEIVGPTIYTSGDFVNEPRVTTADEVDEDIRAQARAGYDLIKFHEIWTAERGYVTTAGLPRPAYFRMMTTARELGLPIVGHAPVNLGMDALIEAGQPLSHIGLLATAYFRPVASQARWLLVAAAAFVTLLLASGATALSGAIRRLRGRASTRHPRGRVCARVVLVSTAAAAGAALLFFPGGPLFDSDWLRVVFTLAAAAIVGATAALIADTIARWDDATGRQRGESLLLCLMATVLAAWSIVWTPIAWRSSAAGIELLVARLRDAGVSIQSTLVVYEAGTRAGAERLMQDRATQSLSAATRAVWSRLLAEQSDEIPENYRVSMLKLTKALHTAGVPIVAGTDAMGVPYLAPGASLTRELELLVAGGLTPYEALRAATVAPAAFLRQGDEFGVIAAGQRADLLLLTENPLDDVSAVRGIAGVMVAGRWLPRQELDSLLDSLAR